MNRVIQHINIGVIHNQPSWVFEYTDGRTESFQLDISTARQFYMGLQEVVLLCENSAGSMATDGVSVSDSVAMRIVGDADE